MAEFKFGIDGAYVDGVPLRGYGIPVTPGKTMFVDYGNGSDNVNLKSNGMRRPFKTISKALDLATTDKDDVVCLIGNSTHTLTEMLNVSKNRVHFVGIDGSGRLYGQNAKVSLGVTTSASDIGSIKNTGVRNSFHNIKFMNSNTVAEGIYCFVEAGEYSVMSACEIYKDTDLDQTGAAELVMNGDSALVVGCTIGSNVNAISGAIIRPNVLVTREIVTGKVARDVTFRDCIFWKNAGNVGNRFVYGANATDAERMFLMDRCLFFSTKLSTAVPAQCVAFAFAQTEGHVLLRNCDSIGNTKLSTTTGVYILGVVPTYATSGIAVAA